MPVTARCRWPERRRSRRRATRPRDFIVLSLATHDDHGVTTWHRVTGYLGQDPGGDSKEDEREDRGEGSHLPGSAAQVFDTQTGKIYVWMPKDEKAAGPARR